jgi:hypothetical protein
MDRWKKGDARALAVSCGGKDASRTHLNDDDERLQRNGNNYFSSLTQLSLFPPFFFRLSLGFLFEFAVQISRTFIHL